MKYKLPSFLHEPRCNKDVARNISRFRRENNCNDHQDLKIRISDSDQNRLFGVSFGGVDLILKSNGEVQAWNYSECKDGGLFDKMYMIVGLIKPHDDLLVLSNEDSLNKFLSKIY